MIMHTHFCNAHMCVGVGCCPLDSSTNQQLRAMMLKISVPRWVFTASVASHAQRCLKRLGIDDLFLGIIDCKACNLATKHSPEAFECAMAVAGVPKEEGSRCLFFDDSVKNLKTAKVLNSIFFLQTSPLGFVLVGFLSSSWCTAFAVVDVFSSLPGASSHSLLHD